MNSKLLFLGGCIPARLALVYLAYSLKKDYLPYLAIPLLLIGASFIYLYLSNSRLRAREAGGYTWWKDIRPVHGCLYLLAGIYALTKTNYSWIVLLIDVIFGLSSFLYHHYLN
jgi:hypothetical protein